MTDLFSTDVLTGVVQQLKPAPQFFLDRYFQDVQTEASEEIHFDVVAKQRRVAPFVSPLVEGKLVESAGFTTKTFKPAYVKPKNRFTPGRAVKRSPGEPIGGSLSPQQRMEILVRMDLQDHVDQIARREELMAAQALATGTVTVSGEKYPTTVVNFGRAVAHTITKPSDEQWNDSGIKPLDDLQDWALLALQTEGVGLQDVIMSVAVWKVFREHADVKARLDTRFVTENAMRQGAVFGEGGTYMGTVDGFNIFVYAGWYLDDNGNEQPIFPADGVLLTGAAVEGRRAYGAIMDVDALIALERYSKSWVDQDPSVRYIMTQSAPLTVPYRPNATLFADVI